MLISRVNIHSEIAGVFFFEVLVKSRGVEASLHPPFVSFQTFTLPNGVLMCGLNYRFLISSPLEAGGPAVNSMDILSQTRK